MTSRYFLAFNLAALITFALFYAMQMLITNDDIVLLPNTERKVIIIPGPREVQKIPPIHEQPFLQEIEIAPVIPNVEVGDKTENIITTQKFKDPIVNKSVDNNTPDFTGGEGEYLPIVRVTPQYPGPLAEKGIEGYVSLSFTVTKSGTVTDVIILESSHRGFERAAIKAVEKFKYKPRIIDG
ncbi:MAG: TonB family protein [Emcibacteraceae bacterium]|nr:TonB family protein [Emcibacteraceae bacterium]